MTLAEAYIAERGAAVEDWLTSFIEGMFGKVIEGETRYASQFGVRYKEYVTLLDVRSGHESMMQALRLYTTQSMPSGDLKTMTLVWRKKPEVYTVSTDFEAGVTNSAIVKVRWRAHTLEGTDVRT